MAAKSLQELFVEELRDAYDGENRLTKALPKMAKAAEHPELRTAFTDHLRETQQQIVRLEVLRTVGAPASLQIGRARRSNFADRRQPACDQRGVAQRADPHGGVDPGGG